MGYMSNLITEIAEKVENYLPEYSNSQEMDMQRFYNICEFIMDNHLISDSPQTIAELYSKEKECNELKN